MCYLYESNKIDWTICFMFSTSHVLTFDLDIEGEIKILFTFSFESYSIKFEEYYRKQDYNIYSLWTWQLWILLRFQGQTNMVAMFAFSSISPNLSKQYYFAFLTLTITFRSNKPVEHIYISFSISIMIRLSTWYNRDTESLIFNNIYDPCILTTTSNQELWPEYVIIYPY